MFRVDETVDKIFAPKETLENPVSDFYTETHGLLWAEEHQVLTTTLMFQGVIEDTYTFYYMILDFVDGISFMAFDSRASFEEKKQFGRNLREVLQKINQPIEPFNGIDVYHRAVTSTKWQAFSPTFQQSRIDYLKSLQPYPMVYVHGDINPDNILIKENLSLVLLDFADACLAPVAYEIALIIVGLFEFDSAFLKGFLTNTCLETLSDEIVHGLLIHDYGLNIIRASFDMFESIGSVQSLKQQVSKRLIEAMR